MQSRQWKMGKVIMIPNPNKPPPAKTLVETNLITYFYI